MGTYLQPISLLPFIQPHSDLSVRPVKTAALWFCMAISSRHGNCFQEAFSVFPNAIIFPCMYFPFSLSSFLQEYMIYRTKATPARHVLTIRSMMTDAILHIITKLIKRNCMVQIQHPPQKQRRGALTLFFSQLGHLKPVHLLWAFTWLAVWVTKPFRQTSVRIIAWIGQSFYVL